MKTKPYLFLFSLVVILAFILGVRYGQKIEKNNKIVDFILKSPSPTPLPSPTPVPNTEYKSKKWGLKFVYPANLDIKEDATMPAIFLNPKK